jgi:hypothetical protein
MAEDIFKNWQARTRVVLDYIPEIDPIKQRFIEVCNSNESIKDKVEQTRELLVSIEEVINSALFGTGSGINPSAAPTPAQSSGMSMIFNQTQNVAQNIGLDLETLLKRLDEVQNLQPEKKEEAKSLVKNIWDYIKSGSEDDAPLLDLAAKLTALGINVGTLLHGLRLLH